LKGLVSFSSDPVYSEGVITFKAQIQFGEVGRATDIEFDVLEGTTVLLSDVVTAASNPDGMGMFFETGTVSLSLDQAVYTGKTLTIHLDPENKITSDEYTTQQQVDLWKIETVDIP